MDFRAMIELCSKIWQLRRRRFGQVVHIGGDLRENLIGWLIAPRGLIAPKWADGNQFLRMVRYGLGALRSQSVAIDAGNPNIYMAQQKVAAALGATVEAHPRLYEAGQVIRHVQDSDTIGLHVSASQQCRLWPTTAWQTLVQAIRARGMRVKIFGAPDERPRLVREFAGLIGPDVEISTGTLTEFFAALSGVRSLVCLDSFAAHAAYAIGVPTIILTGPSMAEIYKPPSAMFINGGIGMACAPCMNVPTCTKSAQPYQCMREISPDAVLKRLDLMDALPSKTQALR